MLTRVSPFYNFTAGPWLLNLYAERTVGTHMDPMAVAGIIIAITGAILGLTQVVFPLWRKVNRLFDTWSSFVRDWNGEPEEPGREAVPGVMQRLNKLDGELSHNGGSSLKDAVDRLEKNQDKLFRKIEEAEEQRVMVQSTLLEAIKALSAAKVSSDEVKSRARKKAS